MNMGPTSQYSDPTFNPSPHVGAQETPTREYPVMHVHTEGDVGLPALHVKNSLKPEQSELHPPKPPSSQISFTTTRPSPQIVGTGRHYVPMREVPATQEQIEGVVEVPPEQVKFTALDEQFERHPGDIPASQTSFPVTYPSPHM
jgi:hypothetical protein